MKTVTSISGGKTSAYVAANYPTDYNVFALVRIEDKASQFPDKKIRQLVEDRIQAPFVATAEDDMIVYTMLDLEQYIGKEIKWVTGITFDEVVRSKGGWLPNKLHRYCTSWLKLQPIFDWWVSEIGEPVAMQIGYRAKEMNRVEKMLSKCNKDGLNEMKATFGKHQTGRYKGKNKWENVPWRKPVFPLVENSVFKDEIENYWEFRPVRFAPLNNCVGCFHRNPILLRKMYDHHPEKMQWFADQEGGDNGTWRSDMNYKTIFQHHLQYELSFAEFSECDSGLCGV